MKIAIVGWGVEGQSAYRYFGPGHSYLIVNEEPRDDFPAESSSVEVRFVNKDKPIGVTSNVSDLTYLDGVDAYDLIIYSVTSVKNLEQKFGSDNKPFWKKTKTVLHIFFENVKTKNIIGVTGTKGKGTTSTLIYKLLEAQGLKAHLAGNIGVSVLDILPDVAEQDWVVLELSNFQLYKFPYSPHIAVCLMITEEHLDWHKDMSEYVSAKANLFSHQTTSDKAIYFSDNQNSAKIAARSQGVKIPYFKSPGARVRQDGMIVIGEPELEIIPKTEVGLLGDHNLQNICAALTAVQEATGSLDNAKAVLSGFTGLEHRLELVRTLDGVKYYDDSFGTTPETAIVAINAFKQPKVVILGGSDKGASFDELAKVVASSNVKKAITMGKTGPAIAQALEAEGFNSVVSSGQTMPEIVATARAAAKNGDVVLLSTACASFDLFKDYKDRGDQFKSAVLKLQ